MKKNNLIKSASILFTTIAVATAVMATACSGIIASDSDENTTVQESPVLKIMLENEDRTIFPVLQLSQFKNFKITGKKEGAELEQALGKAAGYETATELSEAKIQLPTGAVDSNWEFTLTADLLDGNNISKTYISRTSKTIQKGQNAVKFSFLVMESEAAEGTGSFSVTFDWSADENNTGKVTKVTAVLQSTAENGTETSYTNIALNGQKVTIADNNIAAGSYRLKVSFFDNDALVAYWQEFVSVAKGITSTANRTISNFTKTYNITYELNGELNATITNPCPTKVTKTSDLFEKGSPTWSGHTFIAWYMDNNTWKQPFVVKDITADTRIYARWIADSDPSVATKSTIVQKIQAANSTDKANPTVIKILGSFTQEDFTATANALRAKEDNDDNDSNDVYIALDFSETITDVTNTYYMGFKECKQLAGITLSDSISGISGDSFMNAVNLQYINISETNPNYSSIDGVICNKYGGKLVAFPNGKECENDSYTTPDSVTSIESYAFYYPSKIKKIIIGKNVEYFNYSAFTGEAAKFVSFEDGDKVWKCRGDVYYNINEHFSTGGYYGSGTYSNTGKTFTDIIEAVQVVQLTVKSGAGNDEENYNLNTEGYNSVEIGSGEDKWFTIPIKKDYKYHLYYCNKNTVSSQNPQFINTDDQGEFSAAYLSAYSSDGKNCYITENSYRGNLNFTALEDEKNVAYLNIKDFSSSNGKVFLLIREEAPESSGGNEGGE